MTHHANEREGYRFFVEREDLRRGTFAPFFRASFNPIAMACFRLFTVPPEPLLSVPFFRRCIADLTVFEADLPYFAMCLRSALTECAESIDVCDDRPCTSSYNIVPAA